MNKGQFVREVDRIILDILLKTSPTYFRKPQLRGNIVSFTGQNAPSFNLDVLSCIFDTTQSFYARALRPQKADRDASLRTEVQEASTDILPFITRFLQTSQDRVNWQRLADEFSFIPAVERGIDYEHRCSVILSNERCDALLSNFERAVMNFGMQRHLYQIFSFEDCDIRNLRRLPHATERSTDSPLFMFARPSLLRRLLYSHGLEVRKFEPRRVMFERVVSHLLRERARTTQEHEEEERKGTTKLEFEDLPEKSFSKLGAGLTTSYANENPAAAGTANDALLSKSEFRIAFLLDPTKYEAFLKSLRSPENLQERQLILLEALELLRFSSELVERYQLAEKHLNLDIASRLQKWLQRFDSFTLSRTESILRSREQMLVVLDKFIDIIQFGPAEFESIEPISEQLQTLRDVFLAVLKDLKTLRERVESSNENVDQVIALETQQKALQETQRFKRGRAHRLRKANVVFENESEQQFVDYLLEYGAIIGLVLGKFSDEFILDKVGRCFRTPGSRPLTKQETIERVACLLTVDFLQSWLKLRVATVDNETQEQLVEKYVNWFLLPE
jgi:hypothetical protein